MDGHGGGGHGRRGSSGVALVDVAKRRAWPVGSWQARALPVYPQMSLAFAPGGRRVAVAVASFSKDPEAGYVTAAAAPAARRPDRTHRVAGRVSGPAGPVGGPRPLL